MPDEAQADSPEPETASPSPSPDLPTPRPRRLHRSRDDQVIAGVCGGVAEYFGIDSALVRIAAVLLVFAGGAGIVLYLVGWIALPEEGADQASAPMTEAQQRSGGVVLGVIFVALGALFLFDEVWPDFLAWKYVWPTALIAVGIAILLRSRQ